MVDHIDNEIKALKARISMLESHKNELSCTPRDNFDVLSNFISERKQAIERNRYSKSIPLARYYDQQQVTYLESILNILTDLDNRLSNLE